MLKGVHTLPFTLHIVNSSQRLLVTLDQTAAIRIREITVQLTSKYLENMMEGARPENLTLLHWLEFTQNFKDYS